LFACNNIQQPLAAEVKNTDPLLLKTDNGWRYKNQPFTGYMIEVENNGRKVYRLPIINGREQGVAVGYFQSGEKLLERPFKNGEKQGVFKQWWPNGNLRYLFNFQHDKYNGKQIVYFHFGKIQAEKNYIDGKEAGVQKIWDSTGNLITNYTVKNKKIYGTLSAKDCMPVSH
jgi:antitoxin component YwqK of YwqJK toxin-antitoxin module